MSRLAFPRCLPLAVEGLGCSCQSRSERDIIDWMKTIMKLLILFVGWCILLVLCWPLALLALLLMPVLLLLWLPLRLMGICIGGLFNLIRALINLPARLLGHREG